MSCSFWLRRHNAAAKKRKQALEAQKQATKTEEKVFGEEPVTEVKPKTVRKTTKKAVTSDDNT